MAINKKKSFFRISIFIIIVFFLSSSLYNLIRGQMKKHNDTYILEYGEIKIENSYKALIVRKEKILKSKASGVLTQYVNDGEKVKRNQKILEITDNKELKEEIEEVDDTDNKIEIKEYDSSQLDNEIEELKLEIANCVRNNEFSDITDLELSLKAKIRRKYLLNNPDKEKSYEEIEVGTALKNGETLIIKTPINGILTYFMDGYEDKLTYDNIVDIDLESLLNSNIVSTVSSKNIVSKGDAICKIIDDKYYYLIILVKRGDQNIYDVSEDVLLSIDGKKLKGYIFDMIPTQNKVAIVIKLDSYFLDFYKKRFQDISITQDTSKGLKVKSSSLIEDERGTGVYVVDENDKIIYRPVSIIMHDKDDVIVRENNIYSVIDDKTKSIPTVKLYDKVIIDSSKYEEGDVID